MRVREWDLSGVLFIWCFWMLTQQEMTDYGNYWKVVLELLAGACICSHMHARTHTRTFNFSYNAVNFNKGISCFFSFSSSSTFLILSIQPPSSLWPVFIVPNIWYQITEDTSSYVGFFYNWMGLHSSAHFVSPPFFATAEHSYLLKKTKEKNNNFVFSWQTTDLQNFW